MVSQLPFGHVTSHAHAFVQVMVPHAPAPLHVIRHCDPVAQNRSPQPPAPQVTMHSNPVGHVNVSPPVSVTMQVFGVVVASQLAQCAGHPDEVCSTQ